MQKGTVLQQRERLMLNNSAGLKGRTADVSHSSFFAFLASVFRLSALLSPALTAEYVGCLN